MSQKIKWLLLSLLFIFLSVNLNAQSVQKEYRALLNFGLSKPIGSLGNWFKSTNAGALGFGYNLKKNWEIEWLLEYTHFNRENLSKEVRERVALSLKHIGILFNGKYHVWGGQKFKVFALVGIGLYNWEGIRGEIQPDISVEPAIPYIAEKKLHEWNWGLRTGVTVQWRLHKKIAIEWQNYYRFIVGNLWPTMQPHIELDAVSGFQTVNSTIGIQYIF